MVCDDVRAGAAGRAGIAVRARPGAREKQIRSDIPAWLSRSYRGHALTRGGNCRLVQCAMRPRVSQSRHRRRVTSTVAGERAAFSDGRSRPCPGAQHRPQTAAQLITRTHVRDTLVHMIMSANACPSRVTHDHKYTPAARARGAT